MIRKQNAKRHTRIRAGDCGYFFLSRATLVFFRPNLRPGDNRLRWENGDDQFIVSESLPMTEAEANGVLNLICQTHALSWEHDTEHNSTGGDIYRFKIIQHR